MNKVDKTHILIVGAGFAGLQAAQTLAKKNVRVTLVDKNNFHLFQPLLYQVASTGLNPSEISAVVRRNFRGRKNVKVLKAVMTGLDKDKKSASFDDGAFTLDYDYLVLGVGGRTCYFGNDAWAEVAPGLKSLEDAITIRNRLLESLEDVELPGQDPSQVDKMTHVVVIGGGPTGVELAGSFAELRSKVLNKDFTSFDPSKVKVTLIEGGDTLLGGYHEKSGSYTKKRLEKMGVEVLLEERVTDVTPEGVHTKGRFIASQNVIWAAGVEGHPLARMVTDKVDKRGRILVTPELQVEGEDFIYASGDMCYFGHDERFPRGLPGVAPAAIQQGKRAALNIWARIQNKEQKPFRYFDKGKMATIGRSAAVAEASGLKMRGLVAWFAWLFIHLIYLVEFQDRIVVFMRWIWSYLTWNWGVRLIFAGPGKNEAQQAAESTDILETTSSPEPDQKADADPDAPSDSPKPEANESLENADLDTVQEAPTS